MAVCLMAASAAFAANLPHPTLPAQFLIFPDTPHGFDWNAFTTPGASPLAFLDEQHALAMTGVSFQPVLKAARLSTEAMEQRAFGWIVVLVGGLLAAFQLIPKFHACRVRVKSLHIALPVH